jgi:organic radical activating enzyme
MNITGLDFLVTFKCNSQCKHCCYEAGPERHGSMDADRARAWLTELDAIRPLKSITIHGGEPFLCFDTMLSILEKARDLGIPQRWVISNGFWAKDRNVADEKLTALKNSGLTAITLSIDAFHQEYVDFDAVKSAVECALKQNLDAVTVDSYFLLSEDHRNTYNARTREYLSRLAGNPGLQLHSFVASFEGRAARLPVEHGFTEEKIPGGKCCPPFWLGSSLKDPDTIEIDARGNVTLCPGISIGNAIKQSLTDIISQYEYTHHPIVKIIVEQGPIGLYRLAQSYGYQGNDRFVNECHLCYEMRKYLRKHQP